MRARALLLLGCLAAPAAAAAQGTACDYGDLEVQEVSFVGNHKFSSSELEAAIITTPSSWMRRTAGIAVGDKRCLDTLEVGRDAVRLRIFYRLRGYYNASVRDSVIALTTKMVSVKFLVDEGAPTMVDSVSIAGLDSVGIRGKVEGPLLRFRGRIFSRVALQEAIDTALVQLLDAGYPYVERPLTNFTVDSGGHRASIDLSFFQRFGDAARALPRNPARIDSIIVAATPGPDSGKVAPATVRALLFLRKGHVYSQEDVIASQRELYSLELVRHVEIGLIEDSLQKSDTAVTVRVLYTEAAPHSVRFGAGWATLDCLRAQARYADRDLFGGAERLDLNARVSQLGLCTSQVKDDPLSDSAGINYYVSGTLRLPTLFGPRNQPSITLFSESTVEYLAYWRITPIGTALAFSRDLAPRGLRPGLPLLLSARLEYGRTQAQPAVFCQLFNLCSLSDIEKLQQNNLLFVLGAGLTHDHTNSLLNATSGAQQRLELRYGTAQQDSGSPSHWTRILGDAGLYRTVGASVLAFRLQIAGLFKPWTAFQPATEFVPPEERLYAGGPNSVRGFAQNLLGPLVYIVDTMHIDSSMVSGPNKVYQVNPATSSVQQVSATGGNTLIVATAEWRLSMPKPAQAVQLAFFVDAGYVWNRGAIMDSAGHTVQVNLSDIKVTPGMGVRYLSAIGPIRVDFGYNRYGTGFGAAYYTGSDQVLRCVSPGNTFDRGIVPSGETCPDTYKPQQGASFFNRLTFNFSIGQAF
ncbi:MAG TPA: BamA/TamA family outer membrane protein [Gemmatimonadaceae bacterium]|nr:BamA/TamA family outer membrane protein [Gemmatimonadaceae bacterium]